MNIDLSKHTISSKINTGEYFEEARKWYFDKYLVAKSQHIYSFIIAAVLCFSSYVTLKTAMINYEPKTFPMPLYFNNVTSSFLNISPLSQEGDSINISIARYMLTYYVKTRESYNPLKINPSNWFEYISKIRSISSRKAFNEFQSHIDPSVNPDSPIVLYKDSAERSIEVKNILFHGNQLEPDSATVIFDAIEKNRHDTLKTSWKAEIQFNMPDMNNVFEDHRIMEFIVTKYEAEQIS